jgi:hypothetical protein
MLPQATSEPENDGLHAFCVSLTVAKAAIAFALIPCQVVKPENKAVPLLIGAGSAIL